MPRDESDTTWVTTVAYQRQLLGPKLEGVWARGSSQKLGPLLISATVEASNIIFISHAQNNVSPKTRGPENLVRGPYNFIVPPFISTLTPDEFCALFLI